MGFHLPDWPYPKVLTVALTLLIASESQSFYLGSAGFKTIASLAFLAHGAQSTSTAHGIDLLSWSSLAEDANLFPVLLLLGLLFSVFGDVLLIPSSEIYHQKKPIKTEGDTARFKAGTFFFALTHIAYIGAFVSTVGVEGISWTDFFVILKIGGFITYWLGILDRKPAPGAWFAVPPDMMELVAFYVVIIWTMVATATATDRGLQKKTGGAWLFMVSDIFVASDVFGEKRQPRPGTRSRAGWVSRSIGWIAYFGAQLILAGCI